MKTPRRWIGPDQNMTIINPDGTEIDLIKNDLQNLNRALLQKNQDLTDKWTGALKVQEKSGWEKIKWLFQPPVVIKSEE